MISSSTEKANPMRMANCKVFAPKSGCEPPLEGGATRLPQRPCGEQACHNRTFRTDSDACWPAEIALAYLVMGNIRNWPSRVGSSIVLCLVGLYCPPRGVGARWVCLAGGGQLLCSVCAGDGIADRSHPAPSSFPMPLLRKAQQYSLGNGARDSNSMSGNACCGTTSVPQAIPALAITGCWMWCLCVVRARARPLYGTESSTFCCPSSSQ